MYRYDEFDDAFVRQRAAQFRDQVARRLDGSLDEDEFKLLRLMNGVYLQMHAYMLRVAIPYGCLSGAQLRKLAQIARTYDKGYGHFTTRQNIQFNWPALVDIPQILEQLAEVQMHAIQTSGNCIRNTTTDPFAGAAADEIDDPRPWCEIIRQWSSLHPEFTFLPRKFKIAVSGGPHDRAAIRVHDIGLELVRNAAGESGFRVFVGGGQGRTPIIAPLLRDFLPAEHLLSYLEATLRVYNQLGRRDNLYKSRIKILVRATGIDAFREQVEAEWLAGRDEAVDLPAAEVARIHAYFAPPTFETPEATRACLAERFAAEPEFARWARHNVRAHKRAGYASAVISLKAAGQVPGDATAAQMEAVAALAERYALDEIRVSHEQNLVLPHVAQRDLFALWQGLREAGLASANHGLIGDMIACPGLDFCNLANARSIPVAQAIGERFADPQRQSTIGGIQIKISGCMNACGHHHVGHIGLLGVDRKNREFYQITLGGRADEHAAIGRVLGPALPYDEVVDAVETLVDTYLRRRESADERFLDTYARIGAEPFREALYG